MNSIGIWTILEIVIFVVVIASLLTICALNTIFSLQIPLSFASWAALFWLLCLLTGKLTINNKQ